MQVTTLKTFEETANQHADLSVKVQSLEAEQATKINDIKATYKVLIEDAKKNKKSLFDKMCRWLRKSRVKVYGSEKKGTYETNQSEIKITKNPAKIEKIDPEKTDKDLIDQAGKNGFGHCIKTTHELDTEVMERLSDEELKSIGYKRTSSEQITITCKADQTLKQSAKV